MSVNRATALVIVWDTSDKKVWKSGTKVAWVTTGAAKNAWNLAFGAGWHGKKYFDNQSRYILLTLTDEDIEKFL